MLAQVGPSMSGGDLAVAVYLGDDVVITRLGPDSFDVDFYGVFCPEKSRWSTGNGAVCH